VALLDDIKKRFEVARRRYGWLDHIVRTVQHYGTANGNLQAGAVTYFGFLSFFPILALAFAVVGTIARVVPEAQTALVDAIETVLPGMVSDEPEDGKIAISQLQEAAPAIFSIGLLAVLYSGLGWLSAMRTALLAVFEKPEKEQPNFVIGKAKDLLALVTLGLVLMVSVGISGVVTSLSEVILEALRLGAALQPLLWLLAIVIGVAASTVLFLAFFKLLADPDTPFRSLLSGAILGAVGFEALKLLSRWLIESTASQPAFQAFGIALVLVVWIYYFSRVVMYAASWAHTSPQAIALREEQAFLAAAVEGPQIDVQGLHDAQVAQDGRDASSGPGRAFAAGAATGAAATLGAAAAVRRRHHD
jgi:membrane protein